MVIVTQLPHGFHNSIHQLTQQIEVYYMFLTEQILTYSTSQELAYLLQGTIK